MSGIIYGRRVEVRSGLEIRADGRLLTGAAIRYGDVSPSHRERFLPGSLDVSPHLAPTLGHRTGRILAYGEDVQVEDRAEALIVAARLPRTEVAERALAGVKAGRFRGWSVEFEARRESRDASGVRVIEAAYLPGLALVEHPSYPGSGVEARQAAFRVSVPTGRRADCTCAGQGAGQGVDTIQFAANAFRDVLRRVEAGANVSAIGRGAGDVIADTRTGSLTLERRTGGALGIRFAPLDTEAGRRTRELVDAGVEVFARPVVNFGASDFEVRGNVARVARAVFDYVLVKPTHRTEGLEPVQRAESRAVEPVRAPESDLLEVPRGRGRAEIPVRKGRRVWL